MNQNRLSHKTPDKDSRSRDEYSEVYVWGSNHYGQLGLEERSIGKSHSTPRVLTLNFIIKEISCGEDHAALVTTRGQIYTLGSNAEGRLGVGSRSIDRASHPTLVESIAHNKCIKISCGWTHTLAVMESGELYSWGAGESGALGTGSLDNAWTPTRISLENKIFLSAKKISAGAFHSAFVSELGTLYVCGSGDAGQLGTGKREKEVFPVQMTLMTERVKDVACGVYHTLILTERSKVYATGGNILGQLGLGSKKNTNIPTRIKDLDYNRVVKVACGQHSAALTEKGEVYVWGTGVFGEQIVPYRYSAPGHIFKDISLNGFFGIALDQDNGVWTWGGNNNGELGLGHYDPMAKLVQNDLLRDKRINRFSCGVSFAIASVGNDESLFQPSISPLKHHRKSVGMVESQRTPNKPEFEVQEETTQRNFGASVSESKMKSSSRLAQRHSSVHRIRETSDIPPYQQRKTSTEKVQMNRPESPEFIDLLAGEKRRQERRSQKEDKDNLAIVEKLLKQKENLEKTLIAEREEKAGLEHNLMVLNKRLQQIENGPEGLRDLSENFKRQARKFNELKDFYEDEARMKDKINQELKSEQVKTKEYAFRLEEKQEMISTLQSKVEQGEYNRKKVYDLEGAKQKLTQQVELLEAEKKSYILDLHKLKDSLSEANMELNQRNDMVHRLESLRRVDQEELSKMQNEIMILNQKLKDFSDRYDRSVRNLDQENELRRQLEEDVRVLRHREEENKDHTKRLISEMDHLKGLYERNMEEEHQNRSRLLQENNSLTQQLNNMQEDLNQALDEKADLEIELEEIQQKNSRLMELFNNEIDRQNDALNQKTHKTAKKAANLSFELTEDSKDDVRRREIAYPSEVTSQNRTSTNLHKSQLTAPHDRSFQASNIEPLSRSVIETRPSALDRSARSPLRRDKSVSPLDDKPTKETMDRERFLNRSRLQSQELLKDQSFEETLAETKRGSAIKLNPVLAEDGLNPDYERIDASRIITPGKNTSILIKDQGTHSGSKSRGHRSPLRSPLRSPPRSPLRRSPLRDLVGSGSKETETLGADNQDYLDDLKEAQSKMNLLERQKNDLYTRMQEFEKKMGFSESK